MAKPAFTSDTFIIDSGVVEGQTIAKWTQDWWTWALNLKTDDNPFTKPDGTRVATNNDGSVFFFAGHQEAVSRP